MITTKIKYLETISTTILSFDFIPATKTKSKGHKVEKRKGETVTSLLFIKNIIINYFGIVCRRALTCKGAKHSPKTSRMSCSSFLAHNGMNQFSVSPVNRITSKTVKQRLSR